jgi:SAM-dependent methyltransferase
MLDSAGVRHGTRFLDLGCGGGGASVLAARRGAQVAGVDAAATLIHIARRRIPHADFRVGDLEALPHGNRSFDVAFASMSIMFCDDPVRALGEMKRVTVPGGRVTVGIWGRPEDCEYRHVLQAVAATLPASRAGNGPFAFSGEGTLEQMIVSAGLEIVDSGETDAPFLFPDEAMMWRIISSAGPIQSALRVVGEPALLAAVRRAAIPFHTGDGQILFRNRFRYATATVTP